MLIKKILLLVWKNLLLRKRHYIVTAFEIILPTFMSWFLAYTKSKFDSGPSHTQNGVTFPVMSALALFRGYKIAFSCDPCIIPYAPNDTETNEVIEALGDFSFHPVPNRPNIEWKPFSSEKDIEAYLADITFDTFTLNRLKAAIVFEKGLDLGVDSKSGTISYKIRLVNRLLATKHLFPILQEPGPNEDNALAYAISGFSYMQLCIDKVLAQRLTGMEFIHTVSLQAFPYPAYTTTKNFNRIYFVYLPQTFVIGFVFMVPAITKVVVSEKETGIRELLKLNGVRGWLQWLGWMINSILFLMISVTISVTLLFIDFGSGALLVYGDPTVWWFVLMLYIISGSAFCFFICSFFTKPSLATTVGIILWFALYFFPAHELNKVYDKSSLWTKIGYALLPNMAIHLACRAMAASEGKAKGTKWTNIGEPISSVDSLTLGHMIMMFIIDTCLYMSLTVYVENVLPSEFGVRKPWYYIFQLSTYVNMKEKNKVLPSEKCDDCGEVTSVPGFEKEQSNADVGVDIRNLCKNFGKSKIAVDGVTVKMYDGEIFILLGHNGAGKTTTMGMLTGMFAPSSGTAIVNGYDITKSLDKARDSLGLCPQHNMLFDKLTCSEHLRFFGQLKGLNRSMARNQTKELLQKLQLVEKEKTMSMDLSGGQKRKLSLGISLIGGTKVAILDEPTSGMDPEARRAIWDLLLEMRGHRTICLTTHFMEEADVLGDRIGIMAAGKLQCCGSSIFLKKFYGAGYTLTLSVSKDANHDEILQLIQKHVSDASMKVAQSRKSSSEMQITLPTDTANTKILAEMFTGLTERKNELGIKAVGLSLTTMDEVFLRVGELTDGYSRPPPTAASSKVTGISEVPLHTQETPSVVGDDEMAFKEPKEEGSTLKVLEEKGVAQEFIEGGRKQREQRLTGMKLSVGQFLALITKKYIYSYKKWKLILVQLIIPSILLSAAIWTSRSLLEAPDPPPPLEITLDSYNNLVTLASSRDPTISSEYQSVIGPTYKAVSVDSTLHDVILNVGQSRLADYRERYLVALDATFTNINAMFNTIPIHSSPAALNLASNVLLKTLDPTRDLRIHVTNHPLQSKIINYLIQASPNQRFTLQIPLLFGIFMPIGLGLLAASFIVFPIEERMCQAKQLQTMTGVSPLTYWVSAFVWDYFLVFLVVCVMITCFPIFQSYGIFTSHGGAGVAFVILMVYGFSAIWLSYLFSLYSNTVAGGFAFVAIIHIISGVAFGFIVFVMENFEGDWLETAAKFRWPGRLFPTFGATMSTMRYAEIASRNGRCNLLSDEAKNYLCSPTSFFLPPMLRECCSNCDHLGISCFKPIPYISWIFKRDARDLDTPPPPPGTIPPPPKGDLIEIPGIAQELIFMVIMAVVYLTILLLLEYHIIQRIFAKICQRSKAVFLDNVNDEDVITEIQRVTYMVNNGNVNEDALVVDNLCKSFGSFAAVSNLTFGVHHGECFGLLGVNGAGKTTTFRMLTGDETRSYGNMHAFMKSLEKNRIEFLSNVGYCPQFDGIIGVLSGRQMLQLFYRLRGVPGKNGRAEAEKWLERMGLLESASVQCQKYSGGMKRRLGVAMAMIGDPPLLLLDEPTSGVDPVSRRQFWEVLRTIRDSDRAIILTSHSMEECEALCSRLGIMVNGQLQCLGGVQHLKNKFAQGYSLSLKLKPSIPAESDELACLRKEIAEKFYPCTLKDIHQNVFQYQLHNTALAWDVLFKLMEELKTIYSTIIENYSLNETSLEEVFLSFARKQYGTRITDESRLKRYLKCKCF